ncbi:hypothetical protein [Planococcus salinarum]|uniref:hypothetical protein n=1 Tax=Planococcus salinarum TaxID=622695 RepID=UPI000E3C66EA|nr:hypothetical protein [Planococcus salinarum]TAA71712.1 hypothetical protein D2909_10320 [Planococcus salinarum]
MLKKIVSFYCLLLSLGAFFLGTTILLGDGMFADFPPEWVGVMPFTSWASLALFGMIVFGVGNAVTGIYGLRKNDNMVFVLAILLGAVCFLCASLPIILLGEWYLPIVQLFLASAIQILLGIIGLIVHKGGKRCGEKLSY